MEIRCPNCETSFVIGENGSVVNGSVANKDGLGYLVPKVIRNKNKGTQSMKQDRLDALKKLGFDVDAMLNAGINLNNYVKDDIAEQIYENGYIKNTLLHRRFILAHTMKLLGWTEDCNTPDKWTENMNKRYNFIYQFKMMNNEINILAHLEESNDKEAFEERKQFFSKETIVKILDEYLSKLLKLLNKTHVPYINIQHYIFKIRNLKLTISSSKSYKQIKKDFIDIYKIAKHFYNPFSKMPTWIDTFKKEGAYYSLQNLIRFHNVTLWQNDDTEYSYEISKENSEETLRNLLKTKTGFQLLAILKLSLQKNNFKFLESIKK